MPNMQLENAWVCMASCYVPLYAVNTWPSYIWKRLVDLDFCANDHGKIIAFKDKLFKADFNCYYSLKSVIGDADDVKIEQLNARNPLELFISLELRGLLLDGSKT